MDDFIVIFLIYLFTPFFWVSVLALVVWVIFINYLKKKVGEKARPFLTLICALVGIVIIIGIPLAFTLTFKFSEPIKFMLVGILCLSF